MIPVHRREAKAVSAPAVANAIRLVILWSQGVVALAECLRYYLGRAGYLRSSGGCREPAIRTRGDRWANGHSTNLTTAW